MGSVCLRTMPGRVVAPAGDRIPFTGSAAEVATDVDSFAAAGMTHILFSPPITDFEQLREQMHHIAQEVRPLVAASVGRGGQGWSRWVRGTSGWGQRP